MRKELSPMYFLDTNNLNYVDERFPYAAKKKLSEWLSRRQGTLFVTEQVRNEYLSFYTHTTLPSFVQFHDSKIAPEIKRNCVQQILGLFLKSQRANIEPDLYALVEAGYALGQLCVVNPTFLDHPFFFLTNNMGIVNAAVKDKARAEKIEKIINANGLEHLIPIKPLTEIDFES